ncbi:hypothetical protein V1520DRAFT_13577 [Lipomyces starkeyi]
MGKIRPVPMLLIAVLDTSLSELKRVSPSPDQLEEICTWLKAIILQQKLKISILRLSVFCKSRDLQQISLLEGCKERKRDTMVEVPFNCAISQLAQNVVSVDDGRARSAA